MPFQMEGRFVGMVTDKMRQFWCGLHGHDTLRHFAKGRLSLQCTTCGYETPGWDLKRADLATRGAEHEHRVNLHAAVTSQINHASH